MQPLLENINTVAAWYAQVSSSESYPHNFFARKTAVEQDIDFETEFHNIYYLPFMNYSPLSALADDDIHYSIIRRLHDVPMGTQLTPYNSIWLHVDYPK